MSFGVTAAGFVPKQFADILADLQAAVLANVSASLDLSATTPEGQILTICANEIAQAWEVAAAVFNAYNRDDAEGVALDNIGDLTGVPREGASATQVLCTVTLTADTYLAGALVANVLGQVVPTYSNVNPVVSGGGAVTGVLFQCTTLGATPTVNPNTLTQITVPVTGWSAITNPGAQSQLGANAEFDPDYAVRQIEEEQVQGTSTTGAMAAALIQLGASQTPPVTCTVNVLENMSDGTVTYAGGVALPPHSMAAIVFDGITPQLANVDIARVVWTNKPAGTALVGSSSATYTDPVLGPQNVPFSRVAQLTLYVSMTLVPRSGAVFSAVAAAVKTALAQAAVAPALSDGTVPVGQLAPGTPVVGSQLEGVAMAVPGVFDIQAVAFDFVPSPTNTAPLVPSPAQLAVLLATNVVITQGTFP